MTTGLLAAAVAITVAILAAALLRPKASPVSAVAAMLRSAGMTSFASRHLGAHGHIVLLTLAWLAVAVVAMALGLIARRRRAAGVIGMIAVFGAAAAFSVLTRSGSRAVDVVPALLGGVAGALALAVLASAASPQVVLARAVTRVPGGYQRTGEMDVVGTNRRRFMLASLSVTAVAAVAGVSGRRLMRKGVKGGHGRPAGSGRAGAEAAAAAGQRATDKSRASRRSTRRAPGSTASTPPWSCRGSRPSSGSCGSTAWWTSRSRSTTRTCSAGR